MDEKKLSELFNDAVRDVPPATFGTGEVRQAAHRAAVKRRNTVVAASALAFVLVAGGAVTTVALSGGIEAPTAANAPALSGGGPQNGGSMERREGDGATALQEAPDSQQDNRSKGSKQGDPPTGNAGTAGSTPSGCQADQGLAAALAGELLAAPDKSEVPVPFGCPPGSRGNAYKVTEGTRVGTISIVLTPPGATSFVPLGSEVYGHANAASPAQSGGTLHIVSQPDPMVQPAEAPFVDDLPRIAAAIAPRF
ncbi:hypothetical protein DMH04_56415 [Kibdelosporangium aridum]|uniref:Uncharacterized protein n=1 Tax=Kibdelosporangium aridum TaxID=2030 RepID=A0A428XS96_KIBAR|nr:hypothetical protein [Kibdelosporangium aridum]RSM58164.1 hypothetical protein DMH04_56415 [Kibdelosporangium aridum]